MKDANGRPVVCGKCRSRAVSVEYEPGTNQPVRSCMMCGNREGSKYGFTIKGEEMTETKRKCVHPVRPCSNCKRVLPIQGHDMCGACYGIEKNTPEADRAKALAVARQRFNDPGYKRHAGPGSRQAPRKDVGKKFSESEAPADASVIARSQDVAPAPTADKSSAPIPQGDQKLASFWLHFTADDQVLLETVLAQAKRHRRAPEQHILWMVESYLQFSQEIAQGALPGGAAR